MASLFLSHSSHDNRAAERIARRLKEHGYDSLFLDSDPDSGIKAGREWERELYRNLKLAGAVIVLCSPQAMASRWCFVEIAQAKALGKAVFPVVIEPCQVDRILTDRQAIDLAALGEDEAYRRLFDGLRSAGLDPTDSFDWDPKRPPFPGFNYFDAEDAGIFFGREVEVRQVLEKLTQIQRQGEPRMLVLVGSSGSGKSSLVRAGVLPRLRKDRSRWAVVEPFRPGTEPISELAKALSLAFPAGPARADWKAIRDRLQSEARTARSGGGAPANSVVCECGDDLTMALGHREASILVVVDQAEELLQGAAPVNSTEFLIVLRAATSRPGGRVFALLTLRSDFLGAFQNQPAIRGVVFADITLGLLPLENFPQVIEGPAARAEIALEPGLVGALVADARTDDALPLMAFTLREMFERCRDQAKFTLDVYRRDLGGINGAVARVVERIKPAGAWTPETSQAVRLAFLKFARLNDEGRFTRQPAHWAELPEVASPVLEAFVKARLLTSDGNKVEVTHESLFRVWPDLAGWLDEGRELMLWKKNLKDDVNEWMNHDRSPRYLLSGGRAAEAERWLASHSAQFNGPEVDFLKASVTGEREKQLRLKIFAGVVSGMLIIAIGLGFYANHERQKAVQNEVIAEAQTRLAESATGEATAKARLATSRQLAALAVSEQRNRLDRSLLLAVEAVRIENTYEARNSLFKLLHDRTNIRTFLHYDQVTGVAFSPDGKALAAGYRRAGEGGGVVLFDAAGRTRPMEGTLALTEGDATCVAFSPDGKTLATGYGGGVGSGVVLWDWSARKRLADAPLTVREGVVCSVAFSPDGKTLAAEYFVGGVSGVVLWDWSARKRLAEDPRPARETYFRGVSYVVKGVAFSPDGKILAAGYGGDFNGIDSQVVLWDVAARERLAEVPLPVKEGHVSGMAFSPDGRTLAAGYGGGVGSGVVLWDLATRKRLTEDPLRVNEGYDVSGVAFSPDSKTLVVGYAGGVALWDVATRKRVVEDPGGVAARNVAARMRLTEDPLLVKEGIVSGLSLSPDGKTLAVGYGAFGVGGGVILSDLAPRNRLAEDPLPVKEGFVSDIVFSPDGKTLAAGYSAPGFGAGGGVLLWDWSVRRRLGEEPLVVKEGLVSGMTFSPDGKTLAAEYFSAVGGPGGVVLWDWAARKRLDGAPPPLRVDHVRGSAISPDVKILAACNNVFGGDGGIELWDLATRKRLAEEPLPVKEGQVRDLAFSPDGKTLAAGYESLLDSGVVLWDWAARKRLAEEPIRLKEGQVRGVAFSPDGKTLAVGNDSSFGHTGVMLFDVADRAQLWEDPLVVKEGEVSSVAFGPDGKTVVVAYNRLGSGLVVLHVDLVSWQRIAGQVANRNFNGDEWRQYFRGQPYRRTFRNLPWPSKLLKEEQRKGEQWEREHPLREEELAKD